MASTYTWSVESGSLPPGMSLDTNEDDLDTVITGTPTEAGEYTFTIRITNDVSSDFDDQEYTLNVYEYVLEITPDTGVSIETMFDSNENPKLIQVPLSKITPNEGANHSDKYASSKLLRLSIDIGDGEKVHEFSPKDVGKRLKPNKWYLYRVPTSPNDIKRVFVI